MVYREKDTKSGLPSGLKLLQRARNESGGKGVLKRKEMLWNMSVKRS